jgi:bacterioferritin-associated ferredoxin
MVVAYHITEKVICHCYGVYESQMEQTIERLEAQTVQEVTSQSCAGNGCTACHFRIQRMINKTRINMQCV